MGRALSSANRLRSPCTSWLTALAIGLGTSAQASTGGLAMWGEAQFSGLTFTVVDLNPSNSILPSAIWLPQSVTEQIATTGVLGTTQTLLYPPEDLWSSGSFGVRASISESALSTRVAEIQNLSWGDFSIDGVQLSRSTWPAQTSLVLGPDTGVIVRGTWTITGRNALDELTSSISELDENSDSARIRYSLGMELVSLSADSQLGSFFATQRSALRLEQTQQAGQFFNSAPFEIGIGNFGSADAELALALSASVALDPAFGGFRAPTQTWPSPPVAIPEPSTWALMGLGLVGLAGLRRAQRQKRLLTHPLLSLD